VVSAPHANHAPPAVSGGYVLASVCLSTDSTQTVTGECSECVGSCLTERVH